MYFANYVSHNTRVQTNNDYNKVCDTLIKLINRKRPDYLGAYHLTTNFDATTDLLAEDYPRPSKLIFTAITKRDMFYFLTGVLAELSK